MIRDGTVAKEPINLGVGWVGFDFGSAFGRPTRVVNDATKQAIGSYEGRMLFLGLGTGLGSTLIAEGVVVPLELGHLPFRKRTFEEYVGSRAREKHGKKRWKAAVLRRSDDSGGVRPRRHRARRWRRGSTSAIARRLPIRPNENAFIGGVRLWDPRLGCTGSPDESRMVSSARVGRPTR